jgi:hypothetical protein
MDDFQLHLREVELFKKFMNVFINSYEDGACLFLTDLKTVIYKSGYKFDIPGLEVGSVFSQQGIAAQVIRARKLMVIRLPANVYGVRLFAIGAPLWNDDETEIAGAWVLTLPRVHPVLKAFDAFAPSLAELLPEGGFLFFADKEKYTKRQGSEKFDIPALQIDTPLREGSVGAEAVKQKREVFQEVDASVYGFPVMAAAYPMFDEDTGEVVGTMGLALPRKLQKDLTEIARSLKDGITGVAGTMQQIATASNEVGNSQSGLHSEISQVQTLLADINKVMAFIQEIANQTNMLGLNAAIEAARVGDAGRGFGVVAEEIRKLAEASKNTVAQINKLTVAIQTSIQKTSGASESTMAVVEETAAATEEVNATLEELTGLSNTLANMAENL